MRLRACAALTTLAVVALTSPRAVVAQTPHEEIVSSDRRQHRSSDAPALGGVLTLAPLRVGVVVRAMARSALALQPVLAVTLAPWLSIGVDDLLCSWDWERARFRAMPIGLAIDVIASVRGHDLRLRIHPRYDPDGDRGRSEWRVSASLELRLPEGSR